jgi:hypothetical protein
MAPAESRVDAMADVWKPIVTGVKCVSSTLCFLDSIGKPNELRSCLDRRFPLSSTKNSHYTQSGDQRPRDKERRWLHCVAEMGKSSISWCPRGISQFQIERTILWAQGGTFEIKVVHVHGACVWLIWPEDTWAINTLTSDVIMYAKWSAVCEKIVDKASQPMKCFHL